MSQPFLRNFIILLIYDSVILSYARFTGWYCDEKAVSQCFFLSIIFYCVIIYLIQLFNICYLYNKIAIINITVNKFFLIGNKKAGDSHKPLLRFKSGFVKHICLQNNVSGFNEVEKPVQIFSGFHYLNLYLSF